MYKVQTLEDLEKVLLKKEKRKFYVSKVIGFLNELKILWVIFIVLFLWSYLVTNAQLIMDNFSDRFSDEGIEWFSQEWASSLFTMNSDKGNAEKVEALVEEYWNIISMEQEIAPELDQLLQHNLNSYSFSFNLLPPTNRLVIPSINLDVPLVNTFVKDYDEFNEWTFDSELENGVVKYPTTPNPWQWWNTFFFWHTSQEYWKKNPYWTVFRNIPQLKQDDMIQVVWEWMLYEYKVLKTVVVRPKEVNDVYVSFWEEWKEYITLMWCYPIWRTDKRMMIFAERVF